MNKIYNKDCVVGMKTIPDKTIDFDFLTWDLKVGKCKLHEMSVVSENIDN